jgi:signal transduction histidine kinase
MLKLTDLYKFIEGNFDLLLVSDSNEKILHANRLLCRATGIEEVHLDDKSLEAVLTTESLESIRSGMVQARENGRSGVVYTLKDYPQCSIPLKTGFAETEGGPVYLFFGTHVDSMTHGGDSKDGLIKELFCLYSVAEWIEVSRTIKEFFKRLPEYIAQGMTHPEKARVYAVYLGEKYGKPLTMKNQLKVRLVVNREISGEICVGYTDDDLELIPEEQKMLNEIARMLNLALERKHLSESLTIRREEEEQYRSRFKELEAQIASRTSETEDQTVKLDTANKYLERVNRGWDESKARIETMFSAFPGEVALIDREYNVVMTNVEGDSAGKKCHQAIFNKSTPCDDCRMARILRDKAPITLTIQDDDRFLEVHALPIFKRNHEVDGIMEYYRDVTLEKTYEKQLQQADQLASLGQLVSGIGHEINNPNQFIRGNVKIIKQAIEDMLPIVDAYKEEHPDLRIARLPYDFFREQVMVLVDDMAHGSERIKGIVEGLKRFARRDEGLLVDQVDVNTLIEACSRLVHNQVHKRAELILELDKDVPEFTGNAQKIEQILVNLIVNASHAMADDVRGKITVRTYREDDFAVIEVEDDGKGMNEKTLKQIFDPFFTTKRAKGGTGLGLAISYRIVEEHSGTINVTSKPGEGTKFVIRIPANTMKES